MLRRASKTLARTTGQEGVEYCSQIVNNDSHYKHDCCMPVYITSSVVSWIVLDIVYSLLGCYISVSLSATVWVGCCVRFSCTQHASYTPQLHQTSLVSQGFYPQQLCMVLNVANTKLGQEVNLRRWTIHRYNIRQNIILKYWGKIRQHKTQLLSATSLS